MKPPRATCHTTRATTITALQRLSAVAVVASVCALAVGVAAAGATRTGSCPRALAGKSDLGQLAFVDRGQLKLVDLATCRSRTLVAEGVQPPVRWSADGRYLAYGAGSVVSAGGGAPSVRLVGSQPAGVVARPAGSGRRPATALRASAPAAVWLSAGRTPLQRVCGRTVGARRASLGRRAARRSRCRARST